MKPTFSARTRLRSALEMLATFSPSSQISPEVGRSRQPIRFTNVDLPDPEGPMIADRKSTRLNSSHVASSYAVFCLKKKKRSDDCVACGKRTACLPHGA